MQKIVLYNEFEINKLLNKYGLFEVLQNFLDNLKDNDSTISYTCNKKNLNILIIASFTKVASNLNRKTVSIEINDEKNNYIIDLTYENNELSYARII